ncbi:MFS transporter [Pseudonocardia charpentierae]|uniref:MFS transporter n=1 Tax=Pseudonocardia charpentierae TaxID=3075545 RepID=A0ABU2N870_9PSEU|nr:MFS transporter [Pseudonocardia sp. DSM 45834]MDT0350147.1 MFS transporter [Pseudonocardia sp. DSM 45834]
MRSLIPARIDRLPWSPFHTRMVAALGVAWILDGLEISIASAVGDTLTHPDTLGLSSTQVGLLATVYLILGIVIIFIRRHLPESPRWQVMHGRTDEAEKSIAFMEHEVQEKTGRELPPVDESKAIDVKAGEDHGYLTLLRVLFREYPTRSILGATMMITQSFLYNAIFFTATLVLGKF